MPNHFHLYQIPEGKTVAGLFRMQVLQEQNSAFRNRQDDADESKWSDSGGTQISQNYTFGQASQTHDECF
jgi:hypothetical protein